MSLSFQITELPKELFLCHGLQILSVSDNDLHNIPPAISSLSILTSLDISKNGKEFFNVAENLVFVTVHCNNKFKQMNFPETRKLHLKRKILAPTLHCMSTGPLILIGWWISIFYTFLPNIYHFLFD